MQPILFTALSPSLPSLHPWYTFSHPYIPFLPLAQVSLFPLHAYSCPPST
jgi:hypothetical protein